MSFPNDHVISEASRLSGEDLVREIKRIILQTRITEIEGFNMTGDDNVVSANMTEQDVDEDYSVLSYLNHLKEEIKQYEIR